MSITKTRKKAFKVVKPVKRDAYLGAQISPENYKKLHALAAREQRSVSSFVDLLLTKTLAAETA